jgi:hypothetical protein
VVITVHIAAVVTVVIAHFNRPADLAGSVNAEAITLATV